VARDEETKPEDAETPSRPASLQAEEDDLGYKQTRRQLARGDSPEKAAPEAAPKEAPVRKTAFQNFVDDHWNQWLSQVLMILVLGAFVIGYKMDKLPEASIGLILSGGIVAIAIYSTASPAYDLIHDSTGKKLFALLVVLWVAAAGYPTLRKGIGRTVLASTVLTEDGKPTKLSIAPGNTGPFDLTVSGTVKPTAGQDTSLGYVITVGGDNNQTKEISDQFSYSVHQARVRKGSTNWTEQRNQVEHRLGSDIRGSELTLTAEKVDELLQDGIHVTVHPQSYDPNWFFVLGILVVLGMMFVESRIGDAKTKPHLIMASACTLIFSFWYHKNATASRLVAPALDAVFLAAVTGGIGGTLVGAVVRKASGRDKVKPDEE